MRSLVLIRLLAFLFVTLPTGFAAHAQTTTAAASHSENEDLRQTVRELAVRVSALEEELHRQRAGTVVESASLKPATLIVPRVDVRSSVESVSSSGVTGTVTAVP
jgi:citrate lyase beta subunit